MLATRVATFVLASLVGAAILRKAPPSLHGPLVSASTAVSGITIVGTLVMAGMVDSPAARWLGFAALVMAAANAVGGFLITGRMLRIQDETPAAGPASTRTGGDGGGA